MMIFYCFTTCTVAFNSWINWNYMLYRIAAMRQIYNANNNRAITGVLDRTQFRFKISQVANMTITYYYLSKIVFCYIFDVIVFPTNKASEMPKLIVGVVNESSDLVVISLYVLLLSSHIFDYIREH